MNTPRWLLALESSTAHGGAALLRDGELMETVRLEEGLRHGRELMAAAASAMERREVPASLLWGVAVSIGPGSYTGIRVGVMAAKALAYGTGCRLAAVSSLAALAESLVVECSATDGSLVMTAQDARRDEVYAGLYRIVDGEARAEIPDAAMAPEEAAAALSRLMAKGETPILAGSGFATYSGVFGGEASVAVKVNPAAVGRLGWRQLLREETADPMLLQPVYLRRDAGTDWRHDHLITQT